MRNFEFSPFPDLETKQFKLRQISEKDVEEIFELRSDTQVNKYLSRQIPKTKADALAFIQSILTGIKSGEWLYWGISFLKRSNLIGTICLWNFSRENNTAEIGFELLPVYHGNGFMKEILPIVIQFGFKQLKLSSILAITHPKNHPSIKLLRQQGFGNQRKISAKEVSFDILSRQFSRQNQ